MNKNNFKFHLSNYLTIIGFVLFAIAFSTKPVIANNPSPDGVIQSTTEIDVWYGLDQKFGIPGIPQRQINILGSTTYADTLEYQLNGGNYIPLSMGPDSRRLQNQGDFAIDIFDSELSEGDNTVVIVANRNLSNELRKTVAVHYTRTQFWPEYYSVDWSSGDLQNKVQYVDGKWDVTPQGIHTTEIGYDRLIAIGDLGWRDYEITVPITMHSMDPTGYLAPSYGPAVGILFRWSGHTHLPVSCIQPDCGYQPYGAIGWYRWPSDDQLPARLQIDMNTALNATDTSGFQLEFNETYIFKMSVQTLESGRSQYKLKVWPQSASEPSTWNLEAVDVLERDPTGGSILLLAHHVEATFGNVVIRPLGSVVESNIVSDDFNRCLYDNGYWDWLNPLADATITVQNGYTDDARLAITVPQGQNHIINVNTNSVPKFIQPINDGDFQIEVKIDSLFSPIASEAYPLNGIVIADNDHSKWIQIEARAKLDGIYLVVISYENLGSSWLTIPWLTTKISAVPISPIRLSVSRYGSRYLVGYQLPDQPWVQRLTFPLHQAVTQTYVYSGNYGGSQAPAHTTMFDYFLNTSYPFSDEDGERNGLITQTIGDGSVTKNPDLTTYSCGQSVELTANAVIGYSFTEWQGDLTGDLNPATVIMNAPKSITAVFSFTQNQLDITKTGTGSGTVTSTPPGINCGLDCSEIYDQGTEVNLTAVATTGSTFAGWSGGGCSGTSACVVTMDAAKTVTANFVLGTNILSVEKSGTGVGTVTSDPPGIDCGDTCAASFDNGTTVTLSAMASTGSTFTGWSGAGCSGTGTCEVTISGLETVTASFTLNTYDLSVTKTGDGSGTITSSPAGINCGLDCSETYNYGTVVTLTALSDYGSSFSGWTGAGCSGIGTCVVTISAFETVTANFTLNTYDLSITKTGEGSGTITSSPSGINCGIDCSEIYDHGTVVTLTTVATVGSTFTGWSGGGCSGTGTCVVTMYEAKTVIANFVLRSSILSVEKTGTGSGTITSFPSGINCGTDCSETYDYGTTVTLTAVATTGSTFAGWSGGGCSGTSACVVTMDAAKTVTANFVLGTNILSVEKSGTGVGTVTSDPPGIDCGDTCAASFDNGTTVTLSAMASTGSTFTGWTGAGCSGTGTCVVTISGLESVTANFTLNTYDLSVTKTGDGSGIITSAPAGINCGLDCSETYDYGTAITLTAIADYGSSFTGWTGAGCSGTGICTLTIDNEKNVNATFIEKLYEVNIVSIGEGRVQITPEKTYYAFGEVVELEAIPNSGWFFEQWTNSEFGNINPLVITIDKDYTLTALFSQRRIFLPLIIK